MPLKGNFAAASRSDLSARLPERLSAYADSLRRSLGLRGFGDLAGLVLHDEALQHFFDEGFVVGLEAGDGFEDDLEIIGGLSLVLIEDENVGGDGERSGEAAKGVEGRLEGAAFVALDLGGVDAGASVAQVLRRAGLD
jgi:hypothetical protein